MKLFGFLHFLSMEKGFFSNVASVCGQDNDPVNLLPFWYLHTPIATREEIRTGGWKYCVTGTMTRRSLVRRKTFNNTNLNQVFEPAKMGTPIKRMFSQKPLVVLAIVIQGLSRTKPFLWLVTQSSPTTDELQERLRMSLHDPLTEVDV